MIGNTFVTLRFTSRLIDKDIVITRLTMVMGVNREDSTRTGTISAANIHSAACIVSHEYLSMSSCVAHLHECVTTRCMSMLHDTRCLHSVVLRGTAITSSQLPVPHTLPSHSNYLTSLLLRRLLGLTPPPAPLLLAPLPPLGSPLAPLLGPPLYPLLDTSR